MPDLILLVDTAVVVPVNIFPLLDSTDFVSRETTVAYNAAGMDLVWNFVTAAGVTTQTAVTPTTAGVYDWTHLGDGIYTIEIPASGGASINNDTEGFGWFTGLATGVLAWRGPIIQFSPANVVNSLVVGSDLLDVSVTQLAGVAQSLTDLKDFADDGYDPSTNKVQGVVLVDTVTTVTGLTASNLDATISSRASQASVDTVDGIVDAILLDTAEIGAAGAGLTAITSKTDNLPSDPADQSLIIAATDSILSKLLKYVQLLARKDAAIAIDNGTELTAINADGGSGAGAFANTTDSVEALRDRGDAAWITATGFSTLDAAGVRTAVGLGSANLDTQLDALPTAIENADTLLDRNMATGADNGSATVRTVRQALRFLRNKWSISGTTLSVLKEDDATTSWTATVSTDAAAEPVIGSDPSGP